jgi:hypothetical protein
MVVETREEDMELFYAAATISTGNDKMTSFGNLFGKFGRLPK